MTLRLSEAEAAALRKTADRENRSMQDVAKTAIREYTSRREQTVRDALARFAVEDAGLMERLADA